MPDFVFIKNKIKSYNKKITIDGDKSLSIRWALLASQAIGKSRAQNLPNSEDVNSAINCLKKLGIKIKKNKKNCEIYGKGINGFNYKKNTVKRESSFTFSSIMVVFWKWKGIKRYGSSYHNLKVDFCVTKIF